MGPQHIDKPNVLNPIYYWNHSYNPNVVRYSIGKIMRRLYCICAQNQSEYLERIYINISDFKKDDSFNLKYKLPIGSYRYTVNKNLLPYYDKGRFYKKYQAGKLIGLEEIFHDINIFTRQLFCYIDSSFYMGVKFLQFPNRTEIIIPGDSMLIKGGLFHTFIQTNSKFVLHEENRGTIYHRTCTRSNLFDESCEYLYEVIDYQNNMESETCVNRPGFRLNSIQEKIYMQKPNYRNPSNKFMCFVSYGDTNIFDGLYYIYNASLEKPNETHDSYYNFNPDDAILNAPEGWVPLHEREPYISFDKKTKKEILRVTKTGVPIDIWLFNIPDIVDAQMIVYPEGENSSDSKDLTEYGFIRRELDIRDWKEEKWNQTGYVVNPYPPENIDVWKYHLTTDTPDYPSKAQIEIFPPNIFIIKSEDFINQDDSEEMKNANQNDSEKLYYLRLHCPRTIHTDSYFWDQGEVYQKYTEEYGSLHFKRFSIYKLNEGKYELPEAIKDLSYMEHFNYDYKDLIQHAFHKDIRGYDLKKLLELVLENPATFLTYLTIQHHLVRIQRTMEPSFDLSNNIPNRIATNTYFYTNDIDCITSLGEKCFIAFTTSDDIEHNNELFINGLRMLSSYEETMGRVYRVFFQPKYVQEYDFSEDSNIGNVLVTTCKHPLSHKVEATLQFSQKGDIVPFPDPDLFGNIAIGDIMIVDKITKEYLDPDNFDYTVNVDSEYIENPFEDENNVNGVTDLMHFLTHDVEYYSTIHGEHIILDEPRAPIENPTEDNYDMSQSNKPVDPNEVKIECKEEADVNREMIITNTTDGHWGQIPDCADKNHNHKIIFSSWKEDPNISRFRAYHNGKLLMDTDFDYTPPKYYGGEAIFDFNKFTEGNIILDYLPYREIRIYDGLIKDYPKLIKSNAGSSQRGLILIDTTKFVSYPVCASMVKVWYNGRLINPSAIQDVRCLGYIMIDIKQYIESDNSVDDNARITIYVDRMDEDCFEYQDMLKKDINRNLLDELEGDCKINFAMTLMNHELRPMLNIDLK